MAYFLFNCCTKSILLLFLIQLFVGSLCATEPDSWKDGCQQSEGCGIQDSIHDDGHTETNMASSDLLTAKTKKKMEESLEPSGEKKSCEQVLEALSKDGKKVPKKLEVSSGVQTTSSMVEQEVPSGFIGVEVSISHIYCILLNTSHNCMIGRFVCFGAIAWLCCFYFMMCCWSLHFLAT